MALSDPIYVQEFSRPLITKQITDFRNDSLTVGGTTSNSLNPLNIGSFSLFQLVIKRQPVGVSAATGYPQGFDPDSYSLKYAASYGTDPTQGLLLFQLDANATACYGTYVAEFRWWLTTNATTNPPSDRVSTLLIVQPTLSIVGSTYP